MLETITSLIAVVCVLLLAYWCSRYFGKRWGSVSSGRYIQIIDRVQVGNDKYLLLVKLQGHTYLVGVSDKGVHLLTEPEGFFEEPEPERKSGKFEEVLKSYGIFGKGGKHD